VLVRFESFVVLSCDETLDIVALLEEAVEELRADAPDMLGVTLLAAADIVRGKLLGDE
jgi:hypothetical protein